MSYLLRLSRRLMLPAAMACILSQCSTPSGPADVVVSVKEQRLALYDSNGGKSRTYPVSTSRYGVSDRPGSYGTPAGMLEVVAKIGHGARPGAVFHSRQQTGEVIKPGTPGRDPIVSRIMWLRGLEPQNKNAYGRCIYIHGTADEGDIGRPVSYGCIRMKSRDVIELFGALPIGTRVLITESTLPSTVPRTMAQAPASRPAQQPPLMLNPESSPQREVKLAASRPTEPVQPASVGKPTRTATATAQTTASASAKVLSTPKDTTEGSFQRHQLADGSTVIYSAPGGSPPVKLRSTKPKADPKKDPKKKENP